MRDKPSFQRPKRLELAYERAIDEFMNRWLNAPGALKDPERVAETLATISPVGRLNPDIERISRGMITAVIREDSTSWRRAAAKATQSGRIHQLLKAEFAGVHEVRFGQLVGEHAALIGSVPQDLGIMASHLITKRKIEGVRASEIARELRRRLPEASESKVALLARTGVASAATSVTRTRAEAIGLNWYEWDTSEDARVRPAHRLMDLVLVNWNDPPAPEQLLGIRSTLGHYHAGNCPNCRCDANVLVDVDQVSWPHKVYTGGRIIRMRKRDFQALLAA